MANTNFGALLTEEKKVWSRDVWKAARNLSFINKFAGKGHNAMVTRITELTKTERGAKAVYHLVTDLTGDGVVGDYTLEGNEEQIKAYDDVVQIDQLRNANRHAGRMANQKTVIKFREQSKDVLSYWLADRIDQMAFLTMSGVAYTNSNKGSARPVLATGQNLGDLAFASDVSAPTTNRHLRWTGNTTRLLAGNTAADDMAVPTYQMIVRLKAYAKDHYMRGITGPDGKEYFHLFMTPQGMASLRLDSDYLANVRYAATRGNGNELFQGTDSVLVDGVWIHEFRHVYNTDGLASGSKWASDGADNGQRALFCGAQALAMADLGLPYWDEEGFDYENQQGIAVGKIFGFKKPKFHSIYDNATEDFGVIAVDTLI